MFWECSVASTYPVTVLVSLGQRLFLLDNFALWVGWAPQPITLFRVCFCLSCKLIKSSSIYLLPSTRQPDWRAQPHRLVPHFPALHEFASALGFLQKNPKLLNRRTQGLNTESLTVPVTVADPRQSLDFEQISPATIAHHTVYEKTRNLQQNYVCQ